MFLNEKDVEDELCRRLARRGVAYQRQYYLKSVGIADVVTEDTIYEVKRKLTRASVKEAIGQLKLYSTSLPGKKLVIVGQFGDGVRLEHAANNAGIELKILNQPTFPPGELSPVEKKAEQQQRESNKEQRQKTFSVVFMVLLYVFAVLIILYPQTLLAIVPLIVALAIFSKDRL